MVHRLEADIARQVPGSGGEGPSEVCLVADERDARVIGDVQPLVSVGRPGVRPVESGHQTGATRISQRPQPERPVDVQPARPLREPVGDLVERIERTGVDLTGLRAHQHRGIRMGQELRQETGAHPTLVIGRHDGHASPTEAHQPERLGERGMGVGADDHVDRGCAEQPVGLHVPAGPVQQRIPGRRQARRVRHRGARHEGHAARRREAEQIDQPARCDVVQLGGDRRHHRECGVLVPGVGQPGAAERHRIGGTDHEAEVARTGRPDGRRATDVGQQLQRFERIQAVVGEPLVEADERRHRLSCGRDSAVVDGRRVVERHLRRRTQQFEVLGVRRRWSGLHRLSMSERRAAARRFRVRSWAEMLKLRRERSMASTCLFAIGSTNRPVVAASRDSPSSS